VRLAALRTDPQAFGSTLEVERDLGEDSWRARLANRAQFAARSGGAVVGTGGGIASEDGQAAELVSMWVHPSSRGAGVGGLLVEAVVDWARQAGFGQLRLWVVEGNSVALRLYLRSGFTRTGNVAPVRPGETALEFEMSRSIG
jgi:GNAT superfamily N-acetyltransferase